MRGKQIKCEVSKQNIEESLFRPVTRLIGLDTYEYTRNGKKEFHRRAVYVLCIALAHLAHLPPRTAPALYYTRGVVAAARLL